MALFRRTETDVGLTITGKDRHPVSLYTNPPLPLKHRGRGGFHFPTRHSRYGFGSR